METFARQQFDLLLHEATGNYAERVAHRCGGTRVALDRLEADPEGEGVWLSEYVDTVFEEHLLDSTAGACFVLEALERRTVAGAPEGTVADVLATLARRAFGDLLLRQTVQLLSRNLAFEG